jgi:solute carrier family 31 (copper transporter), member 1
MILAERRPPAAGAMPVGDGDDADESSSPLWVGNRRQSVEKQTDIIKAMLYAVQVFYSFFIM